MFAKAKNLRWLQATEAGVDILLFPELRKSNVVVTNMARVFAPAISETAISMLLALTRGLVKYYVPQFQKRTWNAERNLVEIDGMTAGIVGMGGIGQFVASKLHYGFNMKDPGDRCQAHAQAVLRGHASGAGLVHGDGSASGHPGGRRAEHPRNRKHVQ